MGILKEKFQSFIDALQERCKEEDPNASVHAYQDAMDKMKGEVKVRMTINGLTDEYVVGEVQGVVQFIRVWNGVL